MLFIQIPYILVYEYRLSTNKNRTLNHYWLVLINPYPLWLLLCFHFVYVCRTDPTQYSTPFNFLSQPIFRIVSITLGFYSPTIKFICLNTFSSAAVTLFSSVNSQENIFNLATRKNRTALMAATSKKYGLLKEFLSKWR